MKILDIGCGKRKYESKNPKDKVIGLDIVKLIGVDVVHDLEKFPWPFKDNEFDMVLADNVLEHVSDLIKTMEEIHRISKNGSTIKINVPYFSYCGAYQDPTHKKFFTTNTFWYFTKECPLNYYSKARFKIVSQRLTYLKRKPKISKIIDIFINLNLKFYERLFSNILPAEELEIFLSTKK